jgi:hypothetical protein
MVPQVTPRKPLSTIGLGVVVVILRVLLGPSFVSDVNPLTM